MNNRLSGVVLAGGASRRMGHDKAAIVLGGATLLERAVRAGIAAGLGMLVVGREQPPGFSLANVRFIVDQHPGSGPLGGLLTAFAHSDGDLLVLACDLPRLDHAAVTWLIAAATPLDPARHVVTTVEGRAQPLFALWRRNDQARLAQVFAAGERSLMRCLATCDPCVVALPADFSGAVDDCDTPEELARLRRSE